MIANEARLAGRALLNTPGRSVYLAILLGVTVAAWFSLSVMSSPFVQPRGTVQFLGVLIHSASDGVKLPARYAERVETIPGARYVMYQTGTAVMCKDEVPVSINAWGGPGVKRNLTQILPQTSASLALVKKWMNDPMGALIGTQVAKDCGWRPGAAVAPKSPLTGMPVELRVIGVMPKQKEPMANDIVIAHYDYINRTKPSFLHPNHVYDIQASAVSPRQAQALAARIEEAFAHDYPPVVANTSATFQNALARFGHAQYVLGCVMLAIFLCAALALVSVLAHTAAQRRAQMALLQVLGFSRWTLFGGFLLESFVIVMIGCGIGIGAGMLILQLLPATLGQFFSGFAIPAWTWWGLPILLAVLLGAAMVIPAITIAWLRPVDVRAL